MNRQGAKRKVANSRRNGPANKQTKRPPQPTKTNTQRPLSDLHFLSVHGRHTEECFVLPSGVTVVFLTPFGELQGNVSAQIVPQITAFNNNHANAQRLMTKKFWEQFYNVRPNFVEGGQRMRDMVLEGDSAFAMNLMGPLSLPMNDEVWQILKRVNEYYEQSCSRFTHHLRATPRHEGLPLTTLRVELNHLQTAFEESGKIQTLILFACRVVLPLCILQLTLICGVRKGRMRCAERHSFVRRKCRMRCAERHSFVRRTFTNNFNTQSMQAFAQRTTTMLHTTLTHNRCMLSSNVRQPCLFVFIRTATIPLI